jgi:hypothetical protein
MRITQYRQHYCRLTEAIALKGGGSNGDTT